MELCGSAFPADPHWRCYNEPPVDAEGWLLPAFEDARWRPAAWASRGSGVVVEALRPAFAAQFGRDARRFVLPAPSLDQEAEKAWNAWESAKESANAAWKKWRAAVDAEKQKNGTAADAVYATSMRGGDPGYNATDSTTSAQSQSNNNTSLKWEDHAPNTTLKRLEWHKPIPSTLHSYFCRIELPNPALAYALEMQQGLGSTKLKKGGASA